MFVRSCCERVSVGRQCNPRSKNIARLCTTALESRLLRPCSIPTRKYRTAPVCSARRSCRFHTHSAARCCPPPPPPPQGAEEKSIGRAPRATLTPKQAPVAARRSPGAWPVVSRHTASRPRKYIHVPGTPALQNCRQSSRPLPRSLHQLRVQRRRTDLLVRRRWLEAGPARSTRCLYV